MAQLLVSHVEIPTIDVDNACKFYKDVFDWDFKPFGKGYLLYNNYNGIMVGIRQVDKVATGDTTVFHVNVDDIENILANAISSGGSTKRAKTVIPAMGWYALITDPDGNTIGLYQRN